MRQIASTLILLVLSFGIRPGLTQAAQGHFIAGGRSQKIEGVKADHGLSIRSRFTWYKKDSGLDTSGFVHADFPAGWLYLPEFIAGWGFKVGGDFFYELGAGGYYSLIFGPGPAVVTGIGFRIKKEVYVSLPVVARLGASVIYLPHIGFEL